jgi:hypothetical protein
MLQKIEVLVLYGHCQIGNNTIIRNAGVVELVDTCDSKSHVFGREGSSPSSGT